ncbi:hypothetical protein I79_008778 [Cricetulus griseus]|uniref:Uncharacterized protein n=1 Tax=Cricetulus griseus TaxID=10029 RepID=G3HE09_CRIGR|nr:hypothetical protein I79_008778 [Cricetulus griseus]
MERAKKAKTVALLEPALAHYQQGCQQLPQVLQNHKSLWPRGLKLPAGIKQDTGLTPSASTPSSTETKRQQNNLTLSSSQLSPVLATTRFH